MLYRAKSSINFIKSMAHLLFKMLECLNTSQVVWINSRFDMVRLLLHGDKNRLLVLMKEKCIQPVD